MIEIIAQPEGWSAEEVERYVTLPLETGLVGMPGLEHVRSQSLFGLADVKFYFGWDTSYATAQQRVLNQLNFVTLPAGVQPQLSPWSAIGELYRYKVVGKDYTAADLKTAEDWILEKQFRQVPGVIDVVGFGGLTKQYHVDVDPYRLRGLNVSLAQLQSAIANANQNVGGQRIALGEQSFDVRGIGLIRSVRDIEQITIAAQKGVPFRVRDVATVHVGAAPRLGIVGRDGEPDIVEGIVLMRYGGDSLSTVKGIHDQVDAIRQNRILPPGMDIETLYDRADLVKLTTHTVMENLITGMVLVSLVLWLFLGKLRAALLVALNLPLALLFAFCGMVWTGTQANLISLGAVDFGIVVDSSVIMMESIFRNFARRGWFGLRAHHRRGPRGRAASVLLHAHHRRGLRAALHPDRRGRRDHGPHGTHLCLCHRWRHPLRADPHPGALVATLARIRNPRRRGKGHPLHASSCTGSMRGSFLRPAAAALGGAAGSGAGGAGAGSGQFARPRVHAQAGRGQLLDPRHLAHLDLPRTIGPLRGPHPRHRAGLPGEDPT